MILLTLLAALWHGPLCSEVHSLHVASAPSGDFAWDPQADGQSGGAVLSADGRFVVFSSSASNLVPDDTNGSRDIFLIDRQENTIERVNLGEQGQQANDHSWVASVSGDGRYVAFASRATNLVPGNTAPQGDVYLRDRQGGTTLRLSGDNLLGRQVHLSAWPRVSHDGRFVVFSAVVIEGVDWVLAYEIQSGMLEIASIDPDGERSNTSGYERAAISGDGRYVAFISNTIWEHGAKLMLRDRLENTTTRIDLSPTTIREHIAQPSISRDGRYIGFESGSSTIVEGDTNGARDAFIHDRELGVTERISLDLDGGQIAGHSSIAGMSDDGKYLSFITNAIASSPPLLAPSFRAYLRDRLNGTTERLCQTPAGNAGNGWTSTSVDALSSDGRTAVFSSEASDLVEGDNNGLMDIFVRDLETQRTERLNFAADGIFPAAGNGTSTLAACCGRRISANGDLVVFSSQASNLAEGDHNGREDVFLYEVHSHRHTLLSRNRKRQPGNGSSFQPAISADGRRVTFTSYASDLVPGDSNGVADVYLLDRDSGETRRISVSSDGAQTGIASHSPAISGDGRFVVFVSASQTLAPGGQYGRRDLFLHDVDNSTTQRVGAIDEPVDGLFEQVVLGAISTNGNKIAFHTHYEPDAILVYGESSIRHYVIDRPSGTLRRILPEYHFDAHAAPSFSDDGRWMALSALQYISPPPYQRSRVLLYDLS